MLHFFLSEMRTHPYDIIMRIAYDYDLPAQELMQRYLGDKKRRGRKRKHASEYIELEEVSIDGSMYLVDSTRNVYTHEVNAPVLIGTLLADGRIQQAPQTSS